MDYKEIKSQLSRVYELVEAGEIGQAFDVFDSLRAASANDLHSNLPPATIAALRKESLRRLRASRPVKKVKKVRNTK